MGGNSSSVSAEDEIRAWLQELGKRCTTLHRLPGDVSPRSYFRLELEKGETAILAAYPPEMQGTYRCFQTTTSLLSAARVPVPEILELDPAERFMLLQDLGRESLFELPLAGWQARLPYFQVAVDLATRIHNLDPRQVGPLNPLLDTAALEAELEQTWRTYLHPQGMCSGRELERDLEQALARLCGDLCKAPLVPCHRDFMARNLMPRKNLERATVEQPAPELLVLDHQDLRLGPQAYDIASLLNDSLFPPPAVEALLLDRSGVQEEAYRLAAVQRTLKAVGTYAAFAERGAPRHLPLIPPTLTRALYQMENLPALAELGRRLRRAWRPWLDEGEGPRRRRSAVPTSRANSIRDTTGEREEA